MFRTACWTSLSVNLAKASTVSTPVRFEKGLLLSSARATLHESLFDRGGGGAEEVWTRAGRVRKLTRSSRSKFKMLWHRFSIECLRSAHSVQFTNSSGPGLDFWLPYSKMILASRSYVNGIFAVLYLKKAVPVYDISLKLQRT